MNNCGCRFRNDLYIKCCFDKEAPNSYIEVQTIDDQGEPETIVYTFGDIDTLKVTLTVDTVSDSYIVSDKTFKEINDAITAGKIVVGTYNNKTYSMCAWDGGQAGKKCQADKSTGPLASETISSATDKPKFTKANW